jgi:putative ABC transport system substrate-binding protein
MTHRCRYAINFGATHTGVLTRLCGNLPASAEEPMRRRDFIIVLGSAAVAWPSIAHAQQPAKVRRIGYLSSNAENDPQAGPFLAAFNEGMQQLGWIDGNNIKIEVRWGAADLHLMTALAKELVSLQPDLIVGQATPVIAALQRETKSIPIVFVVVSDPVGSGFVSSLPRPGGNITGFVNLEASMASKWIELFKEVAPGVTQLAVIFNPDTAPHAYYESAIIPAARSQSVELVEMPVRSVEEIDKSLENFNRSLDGGIVIIPDTFTSLREVFGRVIAIAGRDRIPAIYPYRYMAQAGGLMSYGTDNADLFRRAATYVDRILKGAAPAELPVQLPTKFEFVVNVKSARQQGLDIPLKLKAFADEVIE